MTDPHYDGNPLPKSAKQVIAIATDNIEQYTKYGRLRRPFESDFVEIYPFCIEMNQSPRGRIALAKYVAISSNILKRFNQHGNIVQFPSFYSSAEANLHSDFEHHRSPTLFPYFKLLRAGSLSLLPGL